MQVEIVKGPTRARVLAEARRRFGPDPLVLSVRRDPGADPEVWLATVARETPAAPPAPRPAVRLEAPSALGELAKLRARLEDLERPGADAGAELLAFARRLAQLESDLVTTLLGREHVPDSYRPFVERLEASGYPRAEAVRLVASLEAADPVELPEPAVCYRRLRAALSERVAVAPPLERVQPGLVVFTGGSGVGKTSLAAKLAADLALGGARTPVLGVLRPRGELGVEVVRRAARALDLEFVEVDDPGALAALEARSASQPVILDTASVNPHDERALHELTALLGAAPGAEIHAVVPATHGPTDIATAVRAFGRAGARRLSVTRLDEAPYVGRVLAAASVGAVPIGYLSQGPRIPDDLARPGLDALLDAAFATDGRMSL